MSGDIAPRRLTQIGSCGLTTRARDDGPSLGYWRWATCAEWSAAVQANGGLWVLKVWSSFTNLEWSELGPPFIFTEWGTSDLPVVAEGGHPSLRRTEPEPCRMEHAVFVPSDQPVA